MLVMPRRGKQGPSSRPVGAGREPCQDKATELRGIPLLFPEKITVEAEQGPGQTSPCSAFLAPAFIPLTSFGTTLYLDLEDKNQIAAEFPVLEQQQCRSCH